MLEAAIIGLKAVPDRHNVNVHNGVSEMNQEKEKNGNNKTSVPVHHSYAKIHSVTRLNKSQKKPPRLTSEKLAIGTMERNQMLQR